MQKTEIKTVCVLGLGYVGLPLALALEQHFSVIGFDVNKKRVGQLQVGEDSSGEVPAERLKQSKIEFTIDPAFMKRAQFIIVCVPTPIDKSKRPDLYAMESASKVVGENLSPGTVVVYESTVYPGVTEEICAPVLEKASGLKCGKDFKIGYSPERINPGDKEHAVHKVIKIVSGMDTETLDLVDAVYGKVTQTHRASSIKVAEAAKVIENIQRDLNIALVNELALIFDRMGLKTKEVLAAAGTKWNFHHYKPGLVGGHCIGVDPYYLTHKAMELGYHPEVILAGRRINDNMYKHLVDKVVREMNLAGKVLRNSTILVLGLTFKENVRDFRNSKALDVINELKSYGAKVYGYDPLLGAELVQKEFGVEQKAPHELLNLDGLVLISPHEQFRQLDLAQLKKQMSQNPVLVDLKGFFDEEKALALGFNYRAV